MSITMEVFPAPTPDGQALAGGCRQLARRLFGASATVRIRDGAGPVAYLKAGALADVVIRDATVSEDGRHTYGLMPGWERNLEHALVVSRSYLPMNIRGFRPGGAPLYPHTQGNDAILRWLEAQLAPSPAAGQDGPLHLPRPWKHKLSAGVGALLESHRKARAQRRQPHQVFLSYRGSAYQQAEQLARRLEQGDFPPRRRVVLFRPEELALSDEVLTPLQRWNVLSIISDVILESEEVWVLETPDYLKSWWTCGELATWAYFNGRPRLRVFDPDSQTVRDADASYCPALTEFHRQRMSRFFTNSHPDMMAPESMQAMRRYSAAGLEGVVRISGDQVFSPEFWNHPLLQCERCSNPGEAPRQVDVDAFLKNERPILYPVTPEQLARAEREGAPLPCPNPECPAGYRVHPTPPRYLWYPLPVGPRKSSLESFPCFRVERVV